MLKPIHTLAVALLLLACLAQDSPVGEARQEVNDVTLMDGPVLAEEAKEEEKRKEQLPDFIMAQFKELRANRETFNEVQSFLISIPSGGSYEFKYKIQSNPNPSMIIKIFTQDEGDDLTIIRDHDKDAFLQVSASTNLFSTFMEMDKAYARKFVRLGSYSGSELFVRLEKIRLSGPPTKIDRENVIKNDNFTVMTKKLAAIQQEMKAVQDINRFKFKFQWGFLEREEHYEQEMLKLTGVEAFVILVTSVVQIYCIKSLFDKNGIV